MRQTLVAMATLCALASPACFISELANAGAMTFTDVGLLPGDTFSNAVAISPDGTIVETGATSQGQHTLIWNGGTLAQIPANGALNYPGGVNDSEQVSATLYNNSNSNTQAVVLAGGGVTALAALPGNGSTKAYGINASGIVVGVATDSGGTTRPVMWTGSGVQSLSTQLGGGSGTARAINDAGAVVGYISTSDGNRAFVVDGSNASLLAGGSNDGAQAIAANGMIAGFVSISGHAHAALWTDLGLTDLGFLGNASYGEGVNDLGEVVGYAGYADGSLRALMWDSFGVHDLNSYLPAGSSMVLTEATGINDAGQIIGEARLASGDYHAFLLSPVVSETVGVPEPAGATLLLTMILGLLMTRRPFLSATLKLF